MERRDVIADRAFSERVLARVAAAERARRRRERLRNLVPLATIGLVAAAWAVSLLEGVVALHLLIQTVAWLSAVGRLEQRLGTGLLGSFSPIPLIVSLLLFVAAIAWVRAHQPDPPELPQ